MAPGANLGGGDGDFGGSGVGFRGTLVCAGDILFFFMAFSNVSKIKSNSSLSIVLSCGFDVPLIAPAGALCCSLSLLFGKTLLAF